MMMLMVATAAWAQTYVEQGGLRFSVNTLNHTAEVVAPETGVYSGVIDIPSSVTYEGKDYTVKYIGSSAFQNSTVTNVTVPSSVTDILGNAFAGCIDLTEVTLSEGLQDISSFAFQGTGVTSLTIPGTVTSVQTGAMEAMKSLTKLTFAYGAERLDMDWTVFGGTNNVTELVVDRDFTFNNGSSISYETVKKVTFGEHLTKIPKGVCQGMSLEELNIGAKVTAVGQSAFFNCTLPEGYNFPFAQIKEIETYAFYGCKNLPANLDLTGVEKIDDSAFGSCNLQSVILPLGVTSIGYHAFENINNLKVYAPWLTSPASLNTNPEYPDDHQYQFDFSSATLYVPAGTMTTYEAAVGWKEFATKEYWSFNATAAVTGKGSLKMSNGEAVHANGTNTEKTATNNKLVAEGAGEAVSGLFVREKDLTLTPTPARGYELSTLTANEADIKAAGKVANLLADQTITATFTPIIYNIVYNLGGGSVATANPATYTVEDAAITLVNPTRTAYNFKGWTGTDLTEPTMTVTIAANSIGNREYTATWEPIVYDITYDLASGAVASANPDKYTIETANFTLTNPTKLGYTFTGWTGTDLSEKTLTVTVTTGHYGNRSYTATWEPNPYKVAFDKNGGDGGEMADQNFVYDAAQNLTANAFTRTGYTFNGWNSKADGTGTAYTDKQAVKNLTAVRDEVVTMYAQWTPNPYQVRFNANNGTGTMANQDFVYDTQQALTQNAFTRTGYTFNGWNTAADGSGTAYADKASVKNLTAELNGVVNLYAQWQVITYTLTYDLAGGTVATENPATFTVESETFTLTNPTKKGYTFAGWTGTGLATATTTVTIAKGSIDNRSYTATWTPNAYKVRFNANNGEGSMADQDFVYDVQQALTQNAFTRTGYTFSGWNSKADGSGTAYADKQSVKNLTAEANAIVSLYAQWQTISYTISYNLDGGSVSMANPTSYTIEDAITLNNPTKEHYAFKGWTGTGLTEPTMTVTITAGSTGNRSYTATWEEVSTVVEIGATEWASFACDKAADFSGTGLTAYIATGRNASGTYVILEEVSSVPAGTPVVLNGPADSYTIPYIASSTTDVTANLLKRGTDAAVSQESGKTRYVLTVDGATAVFKMIGTKPAAVPANKAYLEIDGVLSAPQLSVSFGGDTTGIKAMGNGQFTMYNVVYDLQGRKVERVNKKGLYIINGKKTVIK